MIELNPKKIVHPKMAYNAAHHLSHLQIDLVGKCNANCVQCCGRQNHCSEEITIEKAKEIVTAAKGLNIRDIYLTCTAEYTLYRDCVEFMHWLVVNNKGLTIRLDTNGITIPDGFIEALNKAAGNTVDISLSIWGGTTEDYAQNNGVNIFDKVCSNIKRYLMEITNPNVFFRFSCVYISREQVERICTFLRKICNEYNKNFFVSTLFRSDDISYYRDHNVVPLYLRTYYGLFEVAEEDIDMTYGKIEIKDGKLYQLQCRKLGDKLKLIPYGNCHMLGNRILILPNGNIMPCLGTMGRTNAAIGNVNNQPVTADWLKELYNSNNFRSKVTGNIKSYAFPECLSCLSRICC